MATTMAYTVAELKEFLRARDLSSAGTKAELINRLEQFDENIWENIAEEGRVTREAARTSHLDDQRITEAGQAAYGEETRRRESERIRRDKARWDTMLNEQMQRELDLLRRENMVMQRELEIMRNEQMRTRSFSASPDIPGDAERVRGPTGPSPTMSIRAIGDLLSDFDGRDNTFWKWEQQVNLLRTTYHLDENATRVLISSKLKARAASWFHSKAEHITLRIDDLLREMKIMFDHRPSRLSLRRQFENRVWNSGELFTDYFHDKIILGNRVPIAEGELVEYIIDGVTDQQLRNQARIMRIKTTADLLESFENIKLDPKRMNERDLKEKKETKFGRIQQQTLVGKPPKKEVRCFNCSEMGHISTSCQKPKRQQGGCFECGSMLHRIAGCPRRTASQSGESNMARETTTTRRELSAATSMNMVQPATLNAPYTVSISYNIADNSGQNCKYTLCAMLDSGSPISLIKNCLVPLHARTQGCETGPEFCGINGSPLKILGRFYQDVEIEGISIKLNFYIVPDNTMAFMAILGRDFSSHPLIRITWDGKLVITRKTPEVITDELDCAIKQIMNIECISGVSTEQEKLQINSKIGPEKIERIRDMYVSDYIKIKETSAMEIDFEMKIALKHNQPVSFRPRRLSFADKQKLQVILDDLLERGIIRPSESPYASPIVLVRKKNGETRLCIDYRELNRITVKDNFPSQLIDDNIDQLKEKKFFTTLDLKDGYYNVRMAREAIQFTSFVTPLGQYEFLYCPFGLTNAPKVFHRFIRKVFSNLIRTGKMLPFFDDFFIATETLEEHLEILQEIFRAAGQHRLTFRLDKCFFAQNEIDYLGYHVSVDGIRPSDNNIASVINYPIPRNAKEVLRFVALASYFRRFIPQFSMIAKPLYDLIKKEVKFKFREEESKAFETLKKQLSSKPILAIYSPKAETELHCDASVSGFGAILLQKQSDGNFRPISYFSQRTTPAESKYHSFELECLAVVYAVKRFHVYLGGIFFKIMTDCDSFRLTLSKQNINPRISRWAMFLQDYDFEIQYRPGKRMSHVDALSRCHSILAIEGNTFEQTLSICQDKDDEIGKIRDKLQKTEMKFFELCNGLVYRKDKMKKLLFYVPHSMENNVIRTCHDDLGHVGLDKVVDNILKVYWFPKLREKAKDYIANCLRCREFSPPSGKQPGYRHNILDKIRINVN
ncbi:uncharacterized protein LOC143187672 [Calliopsis andreniformis]|uniref:uncharacterized protein LOC143187672 n=1 Tax=Calliopsis andreniformis TaxID=337506 RepID=UPI003FCE84A2